MAILRLAILKLSLWESNATYGASLQNLRYRNEAKVATGERNPPKDLPRTIAI